ncbi:hypothetical protein [Virgibacillus pantothenticus]|uniref:hypothetical protein n=1 Tax=Virgibacillus pantothenticus TaxID=1473 RepID=UPI000956C684|nr:hypothetical protein [Virgibacillus pantothenticus]QTY15505.1 hypothetical protein KBP50_16675 [Virgibacillus pantothenticus]SIT16781.1 hypothetical protein SAMN05421787_12734 [Virgibacillus pantothenticus]
MKLSQTDYQTSYIIEQLHKHGYYDTDNKTYRELKHKLAAIRALKIKQDNPDQGWF